VSTAYFAHTGPAGADASDAWQPLPDHLRSVASLAKGFAQHVHARLADSAYWAGMLHDLGKYSDRFQARLRDPRIHGVNHWQIGAALLARDNRLPAAFAAMGHHTGLPDKVLLAGIARQIVAGSPEASGLAESATELLTRYQADGLPSPAQGGRPNVDEPTDACLLIRLVFSALVDADYLDSARHFGTADPFADQEHEIRPGEWLAVLMDATNRLAASRRGPLSAARQEILSHCLAAAPKPLGIFSLTAPTGGGKTLAALAFALRHAEKHGLRRVVVVLPYTSIIEQTAGEYQRIFVPLFGEECVLEHHSARDPGDDAERESRLRYASETWNAPLIVTTQVQFFESLFSDRPAQCRKLHRLARSVLVFDEVQTLPENLLKPLFRMVKALCDGAGCTAVLSTATPNAVGLTASKLGIIGWSPTEIVPDPETLAAGMRRTTIAFPQDLTHATPLQEIAGMMAAERQALCIVNRRDDAADLFRLLPTEGRFHLSTNMCPAHRSEALDQIKGILSDGGTCRVAATQCVEAGVDFDFSAVWRALGPLPSIVQAAGRCNREGRLSASEARVRVFVSERKPPPGLYRVSSLVTELARALDPGDPLSPGSIAKYFALLFDRVSLDDPGKGRSVEELERSLDFPALAQAVRLIAEDTVPVLVPHGNEGKTLREELEDHERRFGERPLSQGLIRRLRRFSVSLYRRESQRLEGEGAIRPTKAGWRIWTGQYDPHLGCTTVKPEEMIL